MLFRPTFSSSYSGNVLLLLIEGKTGNVFTKLKIISVIASFQIRKKYFKKEKLASLRDRDLEEGKEVHVRFLQKKRRTRLFLMVKLPAVSVFTFYLFWVKAPLSQYWPELPCSKIARRISHENV